MKAKRNIAHYSKPIAKQFGTDHKQTHKILIQCVKNLMKAIKDENDVVIDDTITIFTNKEARINYYKLKKQKQENE